MAESSFAKLDHRSPLARAEVNRVGSGWDIPVGTAIRDDRTSHLPLVLPGGLQAPPLEAPPPPPTEAELRSTLAQCIASRDFVDGQLARAQATADRARQHVESCRARLAEFDGLDAEITEATIKQLRSAGRVDLDDPALRRKRVEKQLAADDLVAAEHAASVLDTAALEARVDADHALTASRAAAVAVAALTAEQLAQRVLDLEDETTRMRVALLGFDRISAGTKQPLPAVVFQAIGADNPELLKPIDASAWQAVLDRLLADAAAEVSVAIPERRKAPPLPRYSPEITYVQPIRPPQAEPAPEQEQEPAITSFPEPTGED